MAEFSVTEAAFSGFRFIKDRPLTVVGWAIAYVALIIVMVALLAVLFGASLLPLLMRNPAALEQDPSRLLGAGVGVIVASILIFGVLIVAVTGVIYAALYRAFLRPEQGGLAFIRLGADEARMMGAYLLLILIWVGIYIAAGVVVASSIAFMGDLGGLGAFIGIVAGMGALIWVMTRLSLAMPMTFDRRRLSFAQSWKLTKGRFWRMFGTYALVFVVAFIVLLAVSLISQGLAVGAMGAGDFGAAIAVSALFNLTIYPLLMAALFTVWAAPTASIYRQLSTDPDKTAEAFA